MTLPKSKINKMELEGKPRLISGPEVNDRTNLLVAPRFRMFDFHGI